MLTKDQALIASNIDSLIRESPERISRAALAERAGIGRRSLGHIEKGESNAQVDTLAAIAKVFRIEPWRLLAPNLGRDLVAKADLETTRSISELSMSIAHHLEEDKDLRDAVLGLILRYSNNKEEGAQIARAIKTLVAAHTA